MNRFIALPLISLLLIVGTSIAQEDGGRSLTDLELVDVYYMDDLDIGSRPQEGVISPNGVAVAFGGREGICIVVVELRTGSCPEYDLGDRPPSTLILHWSPDSRYVAIEQPTLQYFRDGDIIFYDSVNGNYINRTNDFNDARLLRDDDDGPTPLVDFAPTWADESGDLYFVRWQPRADDLETIMRIPGPGNDGGIMGVGDGAGSDELLTDGEPQVVANISGILDPLSVYQFPPQVFDGPMAVSPSGDQMAIIVRPSDPESEKHGLWILDLGSGDLSQVVHTDEIVSLGLPIDEEEQIFVMPTGVEWTETGILIWTFNSSLDGVGLTSTVYRVDDETFEVAPLLDLSMMGEMPAYWQRETVDGIVQPRFANILPDESAIVYSDSFSSCTINEVYCGIWALSLEPDAEPILLTTFDPERVRPITTSLSVGMQDNLLRVLVHDTVFTFEYR